MPPGSRQPNRATVVAPLTPEQYRLQVTLTAEAYATLRRAQDLMRHTVPTGDLSVILERALTLLVRALEQRKFAATDRPRTARSLGQRHSRQIPANVRRRVWQRDGGAVRVRRGSRSLH
jgi:hypothetical protein